jgi:hypothetical protein
MGALLGRTSPKPTARDAGKGDRFSKRAVSRAVLKATAQRPYVLYPAAIGILGGAAALALGPSLAFVIPAVLGAVVGAGGWALDYALRRERYANDYLHAMQEVLESRRAEAVAALERDLAEVGSEEGAGQLERLEEKYRTFETLLARKLQREEITFGRYLGIAEQVFLSALDNLGRIVDTRRSIQAIDHRYVEHRMKELRRGPDSAARREEIASLEARLSLREEQLEKVATWLARNESAMTTIDLTMGSIAEMDTTRGHASMDMESAMQELSRLAGRAQSYGARP